MRPAASQPMKIDYRPSDRLPPLAWLAMFRPDEKRMTVRHGGRVETGPDGWVEGAWNGDYRRLGFHLATVFCGTGCRLLDGGFLFCGSTDRLCPLFSIRRGDCLYVSNSPYFLMTATGTRPIPSYPYYHFSILRIFRQGLHCLDGTLPLADGNALHVHFSAIVGVDRRGGICPRAFDPGPCPDGFESYHTLLKTSVAAVMRNAADGHRRFPLETAVAISSGYDSTACAAVAREAGCKIAHTFLDSRADDPQEDSGAAIARVLGMRCREFDRWAFMESGGAPEAEFGFFPLNSNVPMTAMEEALPGTLYINGSSGDTYWKDGSQRETHHHAQAWSSGMTGISQLEFRLRVGFVTLTPAYIAARHTDAMRAIMTSAEMAPWSVGGKYDRPLPRRIAESGGVPREMFGRRKIGTAHASLTKARYFSASGLTAYAAFTQEMHRRAGWLRARGYQLIYSLHYFIEYRLLKRKQRIVPSSPAQRRFPFLLNNPPFKCPHRFTFAFQWAFDALNERYRTTTRGPRKPAPRPRSQAPRG